MSHRTSVRMVHEVQHACVNCSIHMEQSGGNRCAYGARAACVNRAIEPPWRIKGVATLIVATMLQPCSGRSWLKGVVTCKPFHFQLLSSIWHLPQFEQGNILLAILLRQGVSQNT